MMLLVISSMIYIISSEILDIPFYVCGQLSATKRRSLWHMSFEIKTNIADRTSIKQSQKACQIWQHINTINKKQGTDYPKKKNFKDKEILPGFWLEGLYLIFPDGD